MGQNDQQMIQKLFQQTIINDVLINEQQKWIKQWEIQLKQDEEEILATIRQQSKNKQPINDSNLL